MKSRIDSISTPSPLTDQLKEKSRRRRDDLGRAGQVSAKPTTRRNDLLPLLAIAYVPLDELRSSKRKLRRLDAAHVREVASSIAALGFCAPLLIDRSNVVVDGESSARGREAPGPRQGALRAHRSSLGSRATPAAARGQSSWREGPMGPRRAQDRIRGNDLGRRADRDFRFLPRRNRSSADRRRGRRRVRAARA